MSNPPAAGDNNPPDEFAIISEEVQDLYDTAIDFIDGDPIDNQDLADTVGRLLASLKDVEKRANEHRVYECTPFDEGKKAVQAKYNPLIADTKGITGLTVLAKKACQDALGPWNRKLQAAKDEAARLKREEANKLAQEAQEAMGAASLKDREAAEKLLKESKKAGAAAKRMEKTNVKEMKTVWDLDVVSPIELLRHYWKTRKGELFKFGAQLAEQDVKSGARKIPGCSITSRKVAR